MFSLINTPISNESSNKGVRNYLEFSDSKKKNKSRQTAMIMNSSGILQHLTQEGCNEGLLAWLVMERWWRGFGKKLRLHCLCTALLFYSNYFLECEELHLLLSYFLITEITNLFVVIPELSGVCTDINTMILLWYSCGYISGDESHKPILLRGYIVWFSLKSSNVPHWNGPNTKQGALLL